MNLDVNIALQQGSFLLKAAFRCSESALGVFGPSGCGKSTLFRAIAGLAKPDAGRITLDGRVLFDSGSGTNVPTRHRGVGVVFQDARLFPHWSVEKNLRAGELAKERVKERPFSYDDIRDLLDVADLLDRSISDLSGGEQQRIALGRALLSNPRLMLLDEPVTGLDATLKAQILPFLSKVHDQLDIPTLLISHDLGEIQQLTDRVLLMRDGAVAGHGTLQELAADPNCLGQLRGSDLINLIPATVKQHLPDRGITQLTLPDTAQTLLRMEHDAALADGSTAHVGVAANQIALAHGRVDNISMRNQLEGRIKKITHAPDRSICHVETAAGVLLAEITPGTEKDMGLAPNDPVWALFKSMALYRV